MSAANIDFEGMSAAERTTVGALNESMAMVLAKQSQAEIQARYVMARTNPRDWDQVREKLLKACKRPRFAETARKRMPVGDQQIDYLTIRFVEAALRYAGNIATTAVATFEDDNQRKVRVTVEDLENIMSYSTTLTVGKTVERRSHKKTDIVLGQRETSRGHTVYILEATPEEINRKQNAEISKAISTLGKKLIEGDILEECEDQIKATVKTADAKDPDAAKRRIFDSFAEIGVMVEQIKKYLGHEAQTLNPKELDDLRALYQAIRDGDTSWKEIMDAVDAAAAAKNPPPPQPAGTQEEPAKSSIRAAIDRARAKDQQAQGDLLKPSQSPQDAPPGK